MSALLSRIPSWVYFVTVASALIAAGLLPYDERPVNPDVVEAMQSIISLCQPAEDAAQDPRCDDVRYYVQWCSERGRGMCTVGKFYDAMVGLGFHLPPLHSDRP
jgi:hypothetical protein